MPLILLKSAEKLNAQSFQLQQQIASAGVAAASGGGTLAFVQAQGKNWFGGSGTTETLSAITCTAGNLLIVSVGWWTAANAISSVAGNSNTYILIDNRTDGTTGRLSTYYAKNINSGSTAIAVTWGADPGVGFLTVHEVSGASTSAPLDQHQIGAPAIPTVGVVTSGNVTTTSAGQYVHGAMIDEAAGGTITAGTGFTAPANANQTGTGASEYQIQSAAGAIAATFNIAGGTFDTIMVAIATFK